MSRIREREGRDAWGNHFFGASYQGGQAPTRPADAFRPSAKVASWNCYRFYLSSGSHPRHIGSEVEGVRSGSVPERRRATSERAKALGEESVPEWRLYVARLLHENPAFSPAGRYQISLMAAAAVAIQTRENAIGLLQSFIRRGTAARDSEAGATNGAVSARRRGRQLACVAPAAR